MKRFAPGGIRAAQVQILIVAHSGDTPVAVEHIGPVQVGAADGCPGPGEVSFGGDQNTQPDGDGNKGHLSGTVGDEPAVLMITQLNDEQWIAAKPGDFINQ